MNTTRTGHRLWAQATDDRTVCITRNQMVPQRCNENSSPLYVPGLFDMAASVKNTILIFLAFRIRRQRDVTQDETVSSPKLKAPFLVPCTSFSDLNECLSKAFTKESE